MNKFKMLLSALLVLIIGFSAQAQTINKFFDRLEKEDKYAVITVNKEMFKMISSMNLGDDEPGLKELISGINMLKVYIKEDGGDAKDYDEIKGLAEGASMNNLMSMKEGSERVYLYTVPGSSDNIVKSLLLLVKEDDQNVFIKMDGNIDLQNLSKLTGKLNIGGLDNLKKLEKKEKH